MKKETFFVSFVVIICIASLFIIPVSTLNNGVGSIVKYNIFSVMRILVILSGGCLILINKKNKISTFVCCILIIILFLIKYSVYSEVDLGLLYILAGIIIVDTLLYKNNNIKLYSRILNVAYYLFLFQIIVYSMFNVIYTGNIEITSSFNDANYTGYFLFCLGSYFYYRKESKKSNLLFLLGIFTFSRLYIISLASFIILNMLIRKIKFNNLKNLVANIRFYIVFQIIILVVCLIYIDIFEIVKPEYVYRQGFSRLLNMFDESNYIRCLANVMAFKSINIFTFFIGLKENTFEGLHLFVNKTIFPHNLFWGLYIQYGMVITTIFLSKYTNIFKRLSVKFIPYYICLVLYHSFLGLSSFYSVDLVFQTIVLIILSDKVRGGAGVG